MSAEEGDSQSVSHLLAQIAQLEKNQSKPEDRLKLTIFDQIPFTIWASTRDFKIVLWNPYCERNYGYASKDAIGRDYVDLFVDEVEADDSRKDCRDIIDNDKQFRNFLAYDHARDGSTKTMLTNCFRVYDDDRKAFLQVEVGVDASELNLDLAVERLDSLREYAQKRKAEHAELLQAYRTEVIRSISDTAQRQCLLIAPKLMEVERLRSELKGSGIGSRLQAVDVQERQLNADLKRLQDNERALVRKAIEAKTLEELKTIRDEVGA